MQSRYERYSEPPICPKYEQERLAQYFVEQAYAGSQNAQGLLELTPCDFWPLIQGRSLWLFGDSITMVSLAATFHSRANNLLADFHDKDVAAKARVRQHEIAVLAL